MNISANGFYTLAGSLKKNTYLKASGQIGYRMITAKDSLEVDNIPFINGFGNLGFFLQTNAWSPDQSKNIGVFWLQIKGLISWTVKEDFEKMFGAGIDPLLMGYSVDAGIEIDQVVNAKFGVSQYVTNSDLDLFARPAIKLSVDYSF